MTYDRGMNILDNLNVVKQRDPDGAYHIIAEEWRQVALNLSVTGVPSSRNQVGNVVVSGMGGSGLASDMARDWLTLTCPYEVVKGYELPGYVSADTLVIICSFSGNTEEALTTLEAAVTSGAQVAVITKGGALLERTMELSLPFIQMDWDYQPRMGMFINLNALAVLLSLYEVIPDDYVRELAETSEWLKNITDQWLQSVETADNEAKQLAMWAAGKTPVIYAGSHMSSLAYKWKISFNENSKNVAFCNQMPEFNHNEFIGWSSHPIEKPFAIINLQSSFDHPRIMKRFEVSERMLSGMRPAAKTIQLKGDSRLRQLLYGAVFADFVSVYLGILNGVNPMRVDLIEKFKKELS